MRAVDCPVDRSDHLHAGDDSSLASALLTHAQIKHPDVEFDAEAARTLVTEAAYEDGKHGGRKRSWSEFVGRITTGTDLVDDHHR